MKLLPFSILEDGKYSFQIRQIKPCLQTSSISMTMRIPVKELKIATSISITKCHSSSRAEVLLTYLWFSNSLDSSHLSVGSDPSESRAALKVGNVSSATRRPWKWCSRRCVGHAVVRSKRVFPRKVNIR